MVKLTIFRAKIRSQTEFYRSARMTFEHNNGLNETEILAAAIRSCYCCWCLCYCCCLCSCCMLYVNFVNPQILLAKDVIECGCCAQTYARASTHKITLRSIHAFLEPPRVNRDNNNQMGWMDGWNEMEWDEMGSMESNIVITLRDRERERRKKTIHIFHLAFEARERTHVFYILFYSKKFQRPLTLFVSNFFFSVTFHATRSMHVLFMFYAVLCCVALCTNPSDAYVNFQW